MKINSKQRPVKTAGYDFSKQAARREKRKSEAQIRQASPSLVPGGLRQRILTAPTVQVVKDLFRAGARQFKYASAKTYRAWERAVQLRTNQLV